MVLSMKGQQIDMARLASTNSLKVAIGNAEMNARGDRIDRRGAVIATREEILVEYNNSNPKAVKQVGLNNIRDEVVMSPGEAVAELRKKTKVEERPRRKIVD